MAQTKKKKSKKAVKPTFSLWALVIFVLAFAGVGIYLVVSSFASVQHVPNPSLVSPKNGQNLTTASITGGNVQFVTRFTGVTDDVQMQVAYRKNGSAAWNSFGTTAVKGPDGKLTKANGIITKYLDKAGLNCTMDWGGKTPPVSCKVQWTNTAGTKGYPAFSSKSIYFPTIKLTTGIWQWRARAYNVRTKTYSGWTTPATVAVRGSF